MLKDPSVTAGLRWRSGDISDRIDRQNIIPKVKPMPTLLTAPPLRSLMMLAPVRQDEPECANELRCVFFAVARHAFRLSIKIEIRLANALDGSA
jgi:hypothetical protein